MSSSQLDDLHEQQSHEALAEALGISTDELDELDYGDIESNESNDGLVYNHYIEIQKKSSDEEVLNKVIANTDCQEYDDYVTVYLGLGTFSDEPDDEDYPDEEHPDKGPQSNGSDPSKENDELLFKPVLSLGFTIHIPPQLYGCVVSF